MSSEFSNNVMIIYAIIELPDNRTRVNHMWQASNIFSNGLPAIHATSGRNFQSKATLNLLSGQSSSVGNSRMHRKKTHGVLNTVSWGILMPIGAIIVRYMRVLNSTEYLHVACQCSGYIVAVVGWGSGLKLGGYSKGIKHHSHGNIGIALFGLATLQVINSEELEEMKHMTVRNMLHL